MNKNTKKGVAYLTRGAMIAACYVALTYLAHLFGLANGTIQFRISEALCILPVFLSEAVPGLFAGCLISNMITSFNPADVVFGAIATLIGAVGARLLRNLPTKLLWLATIPTVVANMLIVPPVLIFAFGAEEAYLWLVFTVGVGELVCAAIGGTLLGYALKRARIDTLYQ